MYAGTFFRSFFLLRGARFLIAAPFPGRARIVWRLVASEGLVAADVAQDAVMRRGGGFGDVFCVYES